MGQDLQRRANTAAVLRALAAHGPASVADLRSAVGLSRPTLEAILADLLSDGAVRQREPSEPEGAGRPARTYSIEPDAALVAGVDVGRHKVLVMIADLTGAIRLTERATVPPGTDGDDLLDLVRRTVTAAAADVGGVTGLRALALGAPGVVDLDGKVTRSVVVPQWSGTDVRAALTEWAGIPVEVVNDANLAALGEQWRGAAQGHGSVIHLLAGRRTRAALIVGGELVTGAHGEAGEIGSAPELFFDTPEVLLGDPTADSAQVAVVFRRAREGDHESQQRVQRFCAELARTIRVMAAVLDPEIVVIGGGVSSAGDQLLDGVRAHLHPARTRLAVSALSDTAVALGGVRRAQLIAAAADPRVDAVVTAHPTPTPDREHP